MTPPRLKLVGETAAPPDDAVEVADTVAPAERLTEAGAAERFAQLYAGKVCFDHRRKRWLLFEQHRWAPDADEQMKRIVLGFSRDWQLAALDIGELELRKQTINAAIKLERRQNFGSMLEWAAAMKPLADAGDGWDADAWLLGSPNGVINLRTGERRNGRRADRITMQTGVAFDANATCPRWTRFVGEVLGDDALVGFVQRAIGYSLTGDTSEQCLFLCYGKGANGKGTFTQTLAHVLGDYSYAMPFSTVELHQRSSIPNDLAALLNRRFVSASETNDGTRLNESRVKALTGCDPITARFLHAEFFTFNPVAKYWLSVNHKPIVRDDSHAFWRRMRLIPFTQTFAIDKTLGLQLRSEASGILNWCLQGALAWQRDGLNPPDIVTAATATYERESDVLGDFCTEALDDDPEADTVRAKELYAHYRDWARHHTLSERETLTANAFGRKMSERFHVVRRKEGNVYLDIKLRRL